MLQSKTHCHSSCGELGWDDRPTDSRGCGICCLGDAIIGRKDKQEDDKRDFYWHKMMKSTDITSKWTYPKPPFHFLRTFGGLEDPPTRRVGTVTQFHSLFPASGDKKSAALFSTTDFLLNDAESLSPPFSTGCVSRTQDLGLDVRYGILGLQVLNFLDTCGLTPKTGEICSG